MSAARVRAVVAAMAPTAPETVSDEQHLIADLGYDSLRLMELTVALERAFGLAPYRPEQLAGVLTVGAVVELVAHGEAAS